MGGIITDTRVTIRTLSALRKGVKFIIHQGGTSSGKTYGNIYSILSYLLYDRRGAYEDGEKLLCSIVAEDMPQIKRGVLRDFKDILSKTGLSDIIPYNKSDKFATLPSGTVIEFLAIDEEDKAKAGKRDLLFVNEANNLKYQIFWQLKIRTRESIIIDFNPSGEFWLHDKELPELEKEDYLFTRTTYRDNPSLSKEQVKAIENISDEYLAKVYKEGKTGMLKGLIFPNVAYCDEFPKNAKNVGFGLDFGFTNDPSALIKGGELGEDLYLQELFYETGLTNPDIAQKFSDCGLTQSDEVFADAAEPKSIREIKNKGYNIKAALKGSDSVNFGINLLKRYKRIFITKDSINFRKEANNYKWKEKDGESLNKPVDNFNHLWDATRYYAIMKLGDTKAGRVRAIGKKRRRKYD